VPSIEITNLGPGACFTIQASVSAWPALSFANVRVAITAPLGRAIST
jgi:hypothetical protein